MSTAGGRVLDRLFVWVWLPGTVDPVVAGVLDRAAEPVNGEPALLFTYARSYRERHDAISLFAAELPLQAGTFDPGVPATGRAPLPVHSCLRDAAPDAWGRRVLNLRHAGDPNVELSEMTYLAASGSDRIGALDFQLSATQYEPRGRPATLDQLIRAAEIIEAGRDLPDDLAAAAGHGTSIGGARPKALLQDGRRSLIAKFPSTTDTRPVVKAEGLATVLAGHVGITVPAADVVVAAGRDVLLLERFDRGPAGERRLMLSALTILGLHEMHARHSSYTDIADAIRTGPWSDVAQSLRELFLRLVFNVCIGNTDDHLRNHAAFWDGQRLTLTPAYDLSPQPRSTSVATHAIGITRDGQRYSQLRLCRAAAAEFGISRADADATIDHVIGTIEREWQQACDGNRLTTQEAAGLRGREFLNPYIFYDEP